MSVIIYPNAFWCSLKTCNNLLFCLLSREDEMIIGKILVPYSPKNAYSKVSGSSFRFSFSDDSNDGLSFFHNNVNCSILDSYLLESMDDDMLSKALASSIDLSISKS